MQMNFNFSLKMLIKNLIDTRTKDPKKIKWNNK